MGYVLTIYSKNAYKEYLLPAVMNANYSIVLHKDLFLLPEDIVLDLENVDGAWKILRGGNITLIYTDSKEDVFGRILENGDVCSGTLRGGEQITILVKITDQFFNVFNKFRLDSTASLSIGSTAENTICYDFMHVVSKVHAVIQRQGDGCIIEDRSANGLFVNAKRVSGAQKLNYGDLINVFGLSLVYLGDVIAIDISAEGLAIQSTLVPFNEERSSVPLGGKREEIHIFNRAPRYMPKLAEDTVKIEAPPEPKEHGREPLLLTIGPSITMAIPMLLGCGLAIYATSAEGGSAGIFMYTGLVTAIASALIGTIWAMVNIRHTKKMLREDEAKRFEVYGEYLISCANLVKEKYDRNRDILLKLYMDSATLCRLDYTSPQLWNRNRTHSDFLRQRLGIGEMPFQVKVEVPEKRFTMLNDPLAPKARMIRENYAKLRDVPVCVDLGRKLIGLVGGNKRQGCYPIIYSLTAQLAANNCYTDLKLGFVYDSLKDDAEKKWAFARWLPHVWSEDKRVRYVADNKADVSDIFYELAKVLRMRADDKNTALQETSFKPHYVLFIEDPSVLEGELITKYLLDGRDLGITVVLLAERYEDLPNACEYIIENTSVFHGMYDVTEPVEDRSAVHFDVVSAAQVERFARTLSRIQVNEIETGGELPSSLSFLDMYGVRRIRDLKAEERWRKNRTYDSIKGLLGQKSGGAACYLDVHEKYHGPHGLIAGTTGSGKSETLQTYILSLAVNYSPDDVGFFVIDYKGGGMANLFSELPHLIGQISNLSGNQVHRAMVSIKSENVRRQKVFSEHGVNNINHYTQLYKNGEASVPIPHLFIIIDEFAELKREEPDFMKELISVAQVGRSLGVHLILATQKPSGTVDDNIWSNSKFRLCLRVQDQQDSKDMLHRSDAAYITQAGRCYLQVGNDELFELFQSGWSGAVYDEDEDSTRDDIAKMLSVTGKAALVGNHTKIKRMEKERLEWIDTLLELLDSAAGEPENVRACAKDAVRLAELTNLFFQKAEEQAVEYPRSDYNAQRVGDLVLTYAAAMEHGWDSRQEQVQLVVDLAERNGQKLPESRKRTQLEAVVEYLGVLAQQNGYTHRLQLWMPVLPTQLYLTELPGYSQNAFDGENWPKPEGKWELEAFMGLCDDPVNQAQMPLLLDFAANGHHAVVGAVTSGKSTFLATLLYSLTMRYTPQALNIYALDFSSKMLSAFEELAHVGGVLYENDDDKIRKFFTMLDGILEERKNLFRGGNYAQYVQAEANGGDLRRPSLPAVLVAIDNYSAFRSKTDEQYDDFLLKLSKEGVSCGIYLVITALGFSSAEIPMRLGENLRTVICLEMNDKYAYVDALRSMHLDVLPEANIKGRGLAKVGESFLEFQTALSMEAADDFTRLQSIRKSCAQLNAKWDGKQARPIPEIPEKPVWQDFSQLEDVAAMQAAGHRLPIGYDQRNAAVYGVDLRRTYCYLISGRPRTGKTNLLRAMLAAANGMDADVVVFDFGKELDATAANANVTLISDTEGMRQFFDELKDTFILRNQVKKQCLADDASDDEQYERMQQFRKIFILINSLPDFIQHLKTEEEPIAPFLPNLLDKGANHNIYWFACLSPSDSGGVSGEQIFDLFVRDRVGIHFGGNVEEQRVLDFDYLKYNDRTKSLKPGIGLLSSREDEATRSIVVPLCRRGVN